MVYFVATPIGNLKDITLRALETLKEADVIFCEDTRHTLKLLNAYEIKKPLYACHKFNETVASQKILEASRRGEKVAVVSDAGTPVVSDPGNIVCKTLREAGEPYTLIVGACAFVAGLVLSALPADRFAFLGFLPEKAGEKRAVLEKYKDLDLTLAFHSAPKFTRRRCRSACKRGLRVKSEGNSYCSLRARKKKNARSMYFPRWNTLSIIWRRDWIKKRL